MNHLSDFIDWMNNDVGGNGPLPNLLHGDYGSAMGQSLERHFVEDRQRGGVRMSNLGKPATLLALAKLGYTEPEPKGKSRLIFHMGDMFENFIEVMLQAYGIELLDSQIYLEWDSPSGLVVNGHADYLIKSPVTGEPVVVEAKTMSGNYARIFSKKQDDDRGYITQLSLYTEAKGVDGTWICLDKSTAGIFEIPLNPGLRVGALDRANKVLERVSKVEQLGDVLTMFRQPPAKPEIYKGNATGRYLLPVTLKMSPFRFALYEIYVDTNGYGKRTEYVEAYAGVEHMRKELDRLVAEGELSYASRTG
jgi:hypothetical protein